MTLLANVLLFQAGWFACVLGAARGLPWLGLVALTVIVGRHLARAARPARELALVAAAAILGALFETLLVRLALVRFDSGMLFEATAPYWMVALWAIFATTLNVSLRRLRTHLGLAALLGAVGGPLAYHAGAMLGAIEFTAAVPALVAIACGWAILTPVLFGAARHLDGYAPQ